jgi:ferredoxin-NADP reductase
VREAKVGEIVRLGPPEGEFTLPAYVPTRRMLFITAGSGITPVMAMLRELESTGGMHDVVHIHSERTPDGVIFGEALRGLAARHSGVTLHERHTGSELRFSPSELDALCPDWRRRDAFACGPREMLDAIEDHYATAGALDRLNLERFEIALIGPDPGDGGSVTLNGKTFDSPAGTPMLVSGEDAGLALNSGCRMGICHRCVCTLKEGQVRDLRTGELISEPGDDVQICVSAAAGDVLLEV